MLLEQPVDLLHGFQIIAFGVVIVVLLEHILDDALLADSVLLGIVVKGGDILECLK